MIHAFFKALLFLGAGVVILVVHHEHNMFKMGGLYKKLPVVFWTFLIASASLAALPLISAGFYSKDLILWEVFASERGGSVWWFFGFLGAFVTALYTARMVMVTFFGPTGIEPTHRPGNRIAAPLAVLAVLSFSAGFIELPHSMGHVQLFSGVIQQTLPAAEHGEISESSEVILQVVTGIACLLAIWWAYSLYMKPSPWLGRVRDSEWGRRLRHYWQIGWGFDQAYELFFIRPLVTISRINKDDILDWISKGATRVMTGLNRQLVRTQNGKMRWYMTAIVIGAILTLTLSILL